MPHFYLDHDVSLHFASLLNELGHDATTALNEGTTSFRDAAHLLYAARASRIILTHNKNDFIELHFAWLEWSTAWGVAEQHRGIIVIPQNAGWNFRQMAEEVEIVLRRAETMENRLFRWTPARGWFEA